MAVQSTQYAGHKPSFWISCWLLLSSLVVLWDTGFVLGRPHTFAGGKNHWLWTPYALYENIDYIYGWPAYNAKNGFTSAQASMNILESILNFYYLWLAYKDSPLSVLIGFCSVSLTVSKTALYALNEYFSGWSNVGHNDARTLIFLWILPNGLWLVVPSFLLFSFGRDIRKSLQYVATHSKELKTL